jgi:hypothetical protein
MERTKQPQNAKRRRQWVRRISGTGPDKTRVQTRQDKANFYRKAGGKYLPGEKGQRVKNLHAKRRAAAKRAKASRKRNR